MAEKSSSKASKRGGKKQGSQKRELVAPKGDKRFVKRDTAGKFKESDDVSKSLSQDVKKASKTKVKAGYGDQGDQPAKKAAAKTNPVKAVKKAAKRS